MSDKDLARAAWRLAVGERIAARTVAVDLVRKRLVVSVDDDIWRRQLWTLRSQILEKVAATLGRGVAEKLEIRVVARRIPPATAMSAPGATADEANRIPDPLLRHLYKASRRRASA